MEDKLLFVIGTRPELIKVAPVITQMEKIGMRDKIIVVNTAQHKDLIEPFWDILGVKYDHILDFMKSGQNLAQLTSRAFLQLQNLIDELKDSSVRLIGLMAQGDTTTVMVASMIAFYNGIDFFHLEAGLRSYDLKNPFPEEFNRKVAGISTSFHFAPTESAKNNLLLEGIDENKVLVTGNTVVDAVKSITDHSSFLDSVASNEILTKLSNQDKIVLVTCHRRENLGDNLTEIIAAINTLADSCPDVHFIWPVHPNPAVKSKVTASSLSEQDNVHIIEPLGYIDLLGVLSVAILVITDSGGIQEEAPSFNLPVLVLRETTERPESIDLGIGFLMGANRNTIIEKFEEVLKQGIVVDVNPYGDGLASEHIAKHFLGQFSTKSEDEHSGN